MTDLIDFDIKEENEDEITEEDALKNEQMIRELNYGIMEGLIEVEVDDDGEIRLYPVS